MLGLDKLLINAGFVKTEKGNFLHEETGFLLKWDDSPSTYRIRYSEVYEVSRGWNLFPDKKNCNVVPIHINETDNVFKFAYNVIIAVLRIKAELKELAEQ